jgi:hypothetical protein
MADNKEPETKQVEPEETIFDAVAEEAPTKPNPSAEFYRTGKPYDYYKSLAGKWQKWWDEFNTRLDENGKLQFRTAWSFIRSRTKDEWEREILWEMIGPKPQPEEDKKYLRVPWLGDWQKRREQGFNNFSDPRKFRSIAAAYKERAKQMDAAKSVAPLIIRNIARWEELAEKITQAFSGQPLMAREAPDSPKNRSRLEFFIRMQKEVLEQEARLWGEWFRCHGLDPTDPSHWLMVRSLDGSVEDIAHKTMTIEGELTTPVQLPEMMPGVETKAVALPDGVSIDDLLLAKMLRDKAKRFNMQLPGELNNFVDDTNAEDVKKAKKVH